MRIPFILFVSTEPVGKRGYMTWDQIREVEVRRFCLYWSSFTYTHEYLIDVTNNEFIKDIKKANQDFFKRTKLCSKFIFLSIWRIFTVLWKIIFHQNFDFAFGQHSGVIDINKDKFELPRFPINENYGDLKRFRVNNKFTIHIGVWSIIPFRKKINSKKIILLNLKSNFLKNQNNIENINCYSNEDEVKWDKSKMLIFQIIIY